MPNLEFINIHISFIIMLNKMNYKIIDLVFNNI